MLGSYARKLYQFYCAQVSTPDYLNPHVPPDVTFVKVPIVTASTESLRGYGYLVEDPNDCRVEITRWPAQGWRPVDSGTGDEAGVCEGVFESTWRGDILFGTNSAVDGEYILGYAELPHVAEQAHSRNPTRVLMWHANYHPDGGQMFFPSEHKPFVVPLALPGDSVRPEEFVCFWCDGSKGLYIHANIWHEGVYALSGSQRFLDRQGAVHARVSVDFPREFNCVLEVPLGELERGPLRSVRTLKMEPL